MAPEDPAPELRHSRSVLIIGAVLGLFFVALAVLCLKYPNKTGTVGIAAFFLSFAAMGALLVAEYFRARYALTSDGLRYATLTGNRGTLRWSEVRSASFSQSGKWFVLETTDGRVVRLSCMLTGLPAFARALLEQVPAANIDETARSVFAATAAGDPPSVWQ